MKRFESEGTIVANIYRESVVEPLQAEIAKLREYIELLENQVISMMAEDPIPFLPVDPEEQRRLDAKASDGTQCMIYRSN
jgi:hypothetical protein